MEKKILQRLAIIAVIIGIIMWLYAINRPKSSESANALVFPYPTGRIEFAWEPIPNFSTNYLVKERFDKEYLNVSYNLYQFFLYVKRMPIYIPDIEGKLKTAWLPDDLKYLPIAESALKNDIVSGAWAAGIWQFMPATAQQYGLIINDEVDERYNFDKSTDAAIRYLWDLHGKFWNWALTLASYNRWPNAIANALEDQSVDNYYDLYLTEETSRYVFRILAIKYVIIEYLKKQDLIDKMIGGTYQKPKTTEVSVGKIDDFKTWCINHHHNYQTVRELNSWILGNTLPDGDWKIQVLAE